MALFQKKPVVSDSLPLYSIGANKTVLIVGLGNPEKKYEDTRHNIGFKVIERFAKTNDFPAWIAKKDLRSDITVHTLGQSRVVLCKPTTYMNNSGEAAQTVQHFYRIYNPQTLAVYDELAIPFGQLRTRLGGSDAGHNGVKSLIQHVGDDFSRLRIGIGSTAAEKAELSNFVLKKFSKAEQGNLPAILQESNAIITEFVFSGSLPHDTRTIL